MTVSAEWENWNYTLGSMIKKRTHAGSILLRASCRRNQPLGSAASPLQNCQFVIMWRWTVFRGGERRWLDWPLLKPTATPPADGVLLLLTAYSSRSGPIFWLLWHAAEVLPPDFVLVVCCRAFSVYINCGLLWFNLCLRQRGSGKELSLRKMSL